MRCPRALSYVRKSADKQYPQTTNYRCIITHNSEAQINASERDRATRGSQKLKKQQTVTPTIKANATAVRSRNTKYYILHHDLIRTPRLCDSPNLKRGIITRRHGHITRRAYGPLQVTKQVQNRAGGAVMSRPTTAHAHPPKRCRPSYPLKSNQCKSYSPARHDHGAHHRSSYIRPHKTPFAQALTRCA